MKAEQDISKREAFREAAYSVDDSVDRLAANLRSAGNPENKAAEKKVVGKPFPEITSKSLAGRLLTLPEEVKGKVALVCVAFVRSAQSMIDSWAVPFEREFGKDSRVAVYEVPMISSGWKVLSWMIDSGMRGGIPIEKHGNVVTFYGDYSGYQEALGMPDTSFAYVFLLDPGGVIRWKGQGYAGPESGKKLIETARALLEEKEF
ncbi:hypothetical protein FTO70_13650 [Methanosarcina sp. KYL-1]|uniref:mitochondrial ATPase complex subunit ATP10 n=1 Tax=Methanosarcina sp. KYL-1 TaxID=2602068 RepID=UPI00210082DE|nr:mitochondrial ATPase complex subunit ATP10 [Methanosarcina sp. KYL-1]MCQ1536693.1 hypothetical protein [Methanosarcina sp. KYL-1]